MVAVPGPVAMTRPVDGFTVAAAALLELHVTTRPDNTVPFASVVTAVSCWLGLIPRTRLAVKGLTVTAATGAGVTVSGALPVLPSLVATMFAVPELTADTTPADDTAATAVLSEVHVTMRPVSTRL